MSSKIAIRVHTKIDSEYVLYVSILLLVILNCIPMSLALPEIIRKGMQVLSMMFFFAGVFFCKDKSIVFRYSLLVLIHSLLIYAGWHERKNFTTIVFNTSACWSYYFYGFIAKKYQSKYAERIMKIVLIVFFVSAITTIIGVQKYPLAVRELGRGDLSYSGLVGQDFIDLKTEYKMANIMSWSQVYGLVFVVPFFVALYKIVKKKRYLLCVLICELCIIRSQVTFAMLLSLLIIFFSYFSPPQNTNGYISWFAFFVVLVAAAMNISRIVYILSSFLEQNGYLMISRKLYNLYLLTQGVRQGDVSSRGALYMQSLKYFFDNPIMGALASGKISTFSLSQHSEFFDMVGCCGLIFLAIFIMLLGLYLKNIKRFRDYPKYYCIVLLVGFLSLFVFNPIWYSPQIFIGVFFLPQIYEQIYIKNKDKSDRKELLERFA